MTIGVPIKTTCIWPGSSKCILAVLINGNHRCCLAQIHRLGRQHHWSHHQRRRCCYRKNFLHWNRLCRCRCRQHDLIVLDLLVWNLVVRDLIVRDIIVSVRFGICRHRQFLIFREFCRIFCLCRIFPLCGYCHCYVRINRHPN